MITLQPSKASLLNIQTELDLKIEGISVLKSPEVLQELGNAVFTVGANAFIKAMNLEAKSDPSSYHHIYEWGQIGRPEGRLFVIERSSIVDGSLIIGSKFLKSNLPVPVNPLLLTPGNTGKTVTSRNIFANKASSSEYLRATAMS